MITDAVWGVIGIGFAFFLVCVGIGLGEYLASKNDCERLRQEEINEADLAFLRQLRKSQNSEETQEVKT